MHRFADWKKILLFGLVGAAGCCSAALFGELLLARLLPESAPVLSQVDVMFVLDVTGSMGEEIDGVQRGIQNFAEALAVKHLPVRVGLLAFRDRLVGEEAQLLLFNGQPFTDDTWSFRQQVGQLQAYGGGAGMGPYDAPESSFDALVLAARQPFRPQATRVLVLITDAPPHIPDKEIHSIEAAIRVLQEQHINQLHLAVYREVLPIFQPLHEGAPGEFFPLNDATAARHDFSRLLPQIGEEIAQRTLKGLQTTTTFTWGSFWQLLVTIGAWTGVLAAGITLALIAGQNYYLQRRRLNVPEALKGVSGSLIAGLLAGAAGQILFAAVPNLSGLEAAARIAAWTLLGGLLGRGIAAFVPNLPPRRALLGGSVGGAVGALSFVWAAVIFGEMPGRLLGAAILGLFIGVMIALIEAALREAWLEIRYGSRETRTVSLGQEPVSIGGDARACTVYAHQAPPVAVRYQLKAGQILCEDTVGGCTLSVPPGDQRVIGPLTVTVCVPNQTKSPGPLPTGSGQAKGLMLRLASGRTIPLREGVRVSERDIPGLHALAGDGIVAAVICHPQDPTILGLRNLSHYPWTAAVAQGIRRPVEAGRSIKLAVGTTINFGPISGEIR